LAGLRSRSTTDPGDLMKYEYATVPLVVHALQQILNQWGEDGWELVTVVDNVAYFKRPKA
jgi:hypothetical protein